MDEKNEKRKLKGKTLITQPKIPEQFTNMTADETARNCGVFTLRFGSCNDLKNLDTIGKSDPYAKIYFTDFEGNKIHYFKTPTIQEQLNPVWNCEDITIHYFPGMALLVKIFDEDPGRDELEGIIKIPLYDLFSTSNPGSDFKSATFSLTTDEKHVRTNSVTQLLSPIGITKAKGTVTFQFAYCTDELLKAQGLEKLEQI